MAERIIDRVRAHFDAKETRIIEVAEWGDEEHPLYIYVSPLTLAQKNRLYKLAKEDDLSMMVEALIMKARDKDGNSLFSREDKPELMRSCDPDILGRITNIILGGNEDETEQVKKN